MRARKVYRPGLVLLALLLAAALPAQAAIDADSADDVCAPDADPCVVSQVVRVVPRSRLDFGVRDVEVVGGGRFEFVDGGGLIRCGAFRAISEGPAIRSVRPAGSSFFDTDGTVIDARRECSLGVPAYPCSDDAHCSLSICGERFCSGGGSFECEEDTDCQLGACGFNGYCSNQLVQCDTNADCDLGSCSAQTYCYQDPQGRRECASNADCQLGTCSAGDGSVEIAAPIVARSPRPVTMDIYAAGDIVTTAPINLSVRMKESDGGELFVYSRFGSVTIGDKIRAAGGHLSRGGVLDMIAETDMIVLGDLLVPGGDFDGGEVWLEGRDNVHIEGDIRAESRGGGGYGGFVNLNSEGDVTLTPGADSSGMLVNLDGHKSTFEISGDGGIFDIYAEGDVHVAEGVQIRARGARGNGAYGGSMFLDADNLQFDGRYDGTTRALDGQGAWIRVDTLGSFTLGSAAVIDASGGSDGGTSLEVESSGDVTLAGRIVANAPGAVSGGEIVIQSEGDVVVSGSLLAGGAEDANIRLEACRIDFTPSADVRSESAFASNDLLARESMVLEAGSSLVASTGTNDLVHRAAEKPPVLNGTVEPAPSIVVNAALAGCPECGNSEIDQSETCDDGNASGGDGCSEMCLIE